MAEIDLSQLDDVINRLTNLPEQADQALADTLNFAAEHLLDNAVEQITSELNLEPDYVRGKISIREKASVNRFQAVVSAHQRGLLLSRFDSRQVRAPGKRGGTKNSGVTVQVKKNGPRKHLKSAFFLKLKRGSTSAAGSTAIAIRPGKDTPKSAFNKREWKEIGTRGYAVLSGPSVSQALEVLRDDLGAKSLDKPIDYFLKRLGKL